MQSLRLKLSVQGEEWISYGSKNVGKLKCFQLVGAQKFPLWETLRCLLSLHGKLGRWGRVRNVHVCYFQICKWNCELNVSLVRWTTTVVPFSLWWLFLFHFPSFLTTLDVNGLTLSLHFPCQNAIPGKDLTDRHTAWVLENVQEYESENLGLRSGSITEEVSIKLESYSLFLFYRVIDKIRLILLW